MPKSKYAERLSNMKDSFKEAKNASESLFGDLKLEEGSYIARVQKASFHEKKSDGELMIKVAYLVIDGEAQGAVQFAYLKFDDQFDTETSRPFTVRWINIMGYEWPEENPEQLEQIIDEISNENPTVKIDVNRKGFLSLIERLSDEKEPEQEPEQEETKEIEPAPSPKSKEKKAPQKKKPKPKPKEINLQPVFDFCEAWGVKTEPSDDIEALQERLKEYGFKEDTLDKDDFAALEIIGLRDNPEVVIPNKKQK